VLDASAHFTFILDALFVRFFSVPHWNAPVFLSITKKAFDPFFVHVCVAQIQAIGIHTPTSSMKMMQQAQNLGVRFSKTLILTAL